jgi:hypothetical protein
LAANDDDNDDDNNDDDDDENDDVSVADTVMTEEGTVTKRIISQRGVRRLVSSQNNRSSRSLSRGAGLRRAKSSSDRDGATKPIYGSRNGDDSDSGAE